MIFLVFLLGFFSIEKPIEINHQKNYAYKENINQNKNIEISDINALPIDSSSISAQSVLVRELRGKILFAKKAQEKKEIASLTKLVSAYLAFFAFSEDQVFAFTNKALEQEGEVGNFKLGQKFKRDELIKASLISSSNDSIYLLAESYGLEKFIQVMNEVVKMMGAYQTIFYNPTGLETPQKNISSAWDLSLVTEKIYSQAPIIFSWTTIEKLVLGNNILWTTNLILPKYKSIIVGGKTGFTPSSGECLLLLLKFNRSPFISLVILDSKNRWQDAEEIIKALKVYYGQ
ncbi:MAG: hypothetical protein NZ822_00945 [Patescibacteria group bacterium]|nr:hypothetical protein [Patescibacteria group bacterium]